MRVSRRSIEWTVLVVVVLATWLGWRSALGAWLNAHGPDRAQPRLEIDETTWDFGTVARTAALEASFTVRNTGHRRLLLTEQSPSCNCVFSRGQSHSVQPGEAATVHVVFDPRRFLGAVREQSWFITNDPQRPTLSLTLVAFVEPEAGVDSSAIPARDQGIHSLLVPEARSRHEK